ncbi:hypothetical protein [Paenibacillus sp.]|jgi:hypothetical protein|uniref:hypothetical protein n=1 Tax=Paenibacillus sp. TaxID=58172 RepID=UPI0028182115|nr:hypothetical protein [Paenibacillus sp.]MDR0268052.1 hypothetical protein [Paenibacillus sp.]
MTTIPSTGFLDVSSTDLLEINGGSWGGFTANVLGFGGTGAGAGAAIGGPVGAIAGGIIGGIVGGIIYGL